MTNRRTLNPTRFAGVFVALALAATPAFAVNKDMVQLQTQVQDLQAAVAHLQQSNDERMGVLKDLVQQTADSVNKMSVSVGNLQQQMRTQQEASGAKLDQVSGQVQSLNDSVDEVKARLNSLEKALQSVQNQQQSINAALQNMAPPAGSTPNPSAVPGQPGTNQPAAPAGPDQSAPQIPAPIADTYRPSAIADNNKPSADIPFPATQGPYANTQPQAPVAPPAAAPMPDLYNSGLRDYMAAKYALASSEFHEVIQSYPSDPLSGNAYYYLGEIDYRAGKYAAAIRDYNHVLDQYPANPKIPVSHLHKGMALIMMKDRDGGINEYRALIQRFPNSPEAVAARAKLNGMGVRLAGPQED